ncbi:MAG: class I tRNA ligase family protein, partial [Pseudomonadota bacterium]
LYHRLTTWLAPILVFTMEEVWLERNPGTGSSVHLQDMPDTPAAWLDTELAEKWAVLRKVRRVVTGALERARQDKVIGSSLEAAPIVYVDTDTAARLEGLNVADLFITSAVDLRTDTAPPDAFRSEDAESVAVSFAKATGDKCQRCWKILPDVGLFAHPGVCERCDTALTQMSSGG